MIKSYWPSDVYIASWKEFRSNSDENKVTAKSILQSSYWPKIARKLKVLDLGCGDGVLLKNFLLNDTDTIGSVTLIDPDSDLLEEAKKCFGDAYREHCDFDFILGQLSDESSIALANKHDAIIIAHVTYLLNQQKSLLDFLLNIKANTPSFIVLDEENSIFTSLWKKTAPEFYSRVLECHEMLKGLDDTMFEVGSFEIKSNLANPFDQHLGARDSILSHLTYSNYTEADALERDFVKSTIQENLIPDGLTCTSICYVVKRK